MTDATDVPIDVAIAHDRAYARGLQHGYNLGVNEDYETLNRIVENFMREIREARRPTGREDQS